jgi:hypothetical protein
MWRLHFVKEPASAVSFGAASSRKTRFFGVSASNNIDTIPIVNRKIRFNSNIVSALADLSGRSGLRVTPARPLATNESNYG